jgi:hypothetical protein
MDLNINNFEIKIEKNFMTVRGHDLEIDRKYGVEDPLIIKDWPKIIIGPGFDIPIEEKIIITDGYDDAIGIWNNKIYNIKNIIYSTNGVVILHDGNHRYIKIIDGIWIPSYSYIKNTIVINGDDYIKTNEKIIKMKNNNIIATVDDDKIYIWSLARDLI